MLNDVLPPLEETVFVDKGKWCFEQNFASTRKAKKAQEWLQEHASDFIRADDWPFFSPDLNSLGYKLWSVLEEHAQGE